MRVMDSDLLRRTFERFGSGHWTWLYEIVVDENYTTNQRTLFRLTPWANELTLDAKTFYPAPIQFSQIEAVADGDLPTIEVSVSNADGKAGRYATYGNGFRGHRVTIYGVCVEAIELGPFVTVDTTCRSVGIAVGAAIDSRVVSLQCELSAALVNSEFPRKSFDPRRCRHTQYGRGRCGMIINANTPANLLSCPRTWSACNARSAWMASEGLPQRLPQRYGAPVNLPLQRAS